MRNFGNFGMGQSGVTTMLNPYFAWNGLFTAQRVRKVDSMVAYYPARMTRYGLEGARGFVRGYVGPVAPSPMVLGR